jgi:hypothetical protein
MLRRAFCKTALAVGAAAAVERSIAVSAEEPSPGAVTDIVAITGSGREVSIGKADIKELSEGLQGELLLPADDRYESARRVWNGMIDKRPAMIAVCASAGDVAAAVTSEKRIEAIRRIYAAIEPHMTGFYTNLNEDSESRTWGNYGANYQRLAQIKSRYDSRNLFRLNANVQPVAES